MAQESGATGAMDGAAVGGVAAVAGIPADTVPDGEAGEVGLWAKIAATKGDRTGSRDIGGEKSSELILSFKERLPPSSSQVARDILGVPRVTGWREMSYRISSSRLKTTASLGES